MATTLQDDAEASTFTIEQPISALIPLRKQLPLLSSKSIKTNERSTLVLPFLPVSTDKDDEKGRLVGRVDLLHVLWAACGCSTIFIERNATTDKCNECLAVTNWVKKFLPRQLLRIRINESSSLVECLFRRSSYPLKYVHLNGACINETIKDTTSAHDGEWVGPLTLSQGDALIFYPPADTGQEEGEWNALEFQLISLKVQDGMVQIVQDEDASVVPDKDSQEENRSPLPKSLCTDTENRPESPTLEKGTKMEKEVQSKGLRRETPSEKESVARESPMKASNPETRKDVAETNESTAKESTMASDKPDAGNTVTDMDVDTPDTRSVAFSPLKTQKESLVDELHTDESALQKLPNTAASKSGLPIPAFMRIRPPEEERDKTQDADKMKSKIDEGKKEAAEEKAPPDPRNFADSPAAAPALSRQVTDNAPAANGSEGSKFVLYFVEKGTDMHKDFLEGNDKMEGLKARAKKRGAVVLDTFDKEKPPWPTYLVISERVVEASSIADALGFEDEEELEYFLGEHDIVCATRQWADRGNTFSRPPLKEPSMGERYMKLWPKKRKSPDHQSEERTRIVRRRRSGRRQPKIRNEALSKIFHKLSKLHQGCPLNEMDEWKSYTFHVISGRLRHLDFEIVDDPNVLKRTRQVKGIGASTMSIIVEYLREGECTRIHEFEVDPGRIAMKNMMNIWGVGRSRALKLVHAGYETIDHVRKAVSAGKLTLDRNQYIGMECYEDFLEKLSRSEVETIGAIVSKVFKERFPSAELTIMGSYRRGNEECGDIDILITHPDYYTEVPPRALGQVVDELKTLRHIAHHLTFISGMKHERFESIPESVARRLTNPSLWGRQSDKKDKFSSSSYMGVFNSPVEPGRRRRVDIKFYPTREKIFATLYFTGNGHFNRSMRLWATRKFNYTLSDHGLFLCGTNNQVMEATTERQVFDFLDLVWREPHERDCFDAVTGKTTGEAASQLEELSQADLRQESQDHSWVE